MRMKPNWQIIMYSSQACCRRTRNPCHLSVSI